MLILINCNFLSLNLGHFCSSDSFLAWGENAFEPTEAGDKVRPKEGQFTIKKKFNLLT